MLTIPSLLPPQGHTGSSALYKPFQSVGARGVNNLASKLLLAILPPNSPFFRYKVNAFVADKMSADEQFKSKIESALAKVERAVQDSIETSGDRIVIFEMLKHLIVAGNVLVFIGRDGARLFHLDRYVVLRDPSGNVLEVVVKESLAPAALPDSIRDAVIAKSAKEKDGAMKTVDVYTHVYRKEGRFHVYQECMGLVLPESRGWYPLDKTPWIALRMNRIDGEDYGRGFIEEYIGDLMSLEGLSKAIVEGSAAAARILLLVKPGSKTRQKTIEEAPNGAVREGDATDVTVVQMQKYNDFRVAADQANRIEDRLALAFLLNTAVQRNAERVTAEEIRYVAQELEDALGGVYSILSQEFQLPYVNRKMAIGQKSGDLPKLPKELVRVQIVTGLEALGRGHDSAKLMQFMGTLNQTLGPQIVAQYSNVDEFIRRLATAMGIEEKGLVKTAEQIKAAMQETNMQALVQQFGPEAMKMAGEAIKQRNQPTNGEG